MLDAARGLFGLRILLICDLLIVFGGYLASNQPLIS